jgi:hypothetical protein
MPDHQSTFELFDGRDIDPFFQFFATSEKGQTFGFHLNWGTGLGVSPDVGFVNFDENAAKAADLDPVPSGKGIGNGLEESVYYDLGLLICEIVSVLQLIDQIGLVHLHLLL